MVSHNKKKRNHKPRVKPDHQVSEDQNISQDAELQDVPEVESPSRKRELPDEDDDSDVEKKPRKKKKKKQPVSTEGGDKKGKKSIRQTKREKHAERLADAQAASKDQLKSQCLNYISQWKHDKSNWKFMKVKQIWLIKNKFSTQMIPNESWPLLLEYLDSIKGNARNALVDDANKIIKQMDEWTEKNNSKGKEEDDDADDESAEGGKPDDIVYKRARDIIQCFQ